MPPAEVRNTQEEKSLFDNTYVAAFKDSVYFDHNHSYAWLHCLFWWDFRLANKHLFQD